MKSAAESIQEKVQALTPEQQAKVAALIAILQDEEQGGAASSLSEASFAAVWNDPANDVYDTL